jgi:hypothetical protein
MRRSRGWEIVLMRRDLRAAPISGHERFTVAHELGHYLLLKETAFRPRREADYWLGESLCNHFASKLLIPHRLLVGICEPSTSAELAAFVTTVARSAGVTHEPAARALAAHLDNPVALGTFRLDPRASTGRLGFRGWWVENRRWWGARGGRRLAVYADHALAPVLQRMRVMCPGQTDTPDLAGAVCTLLRRRSGVTASFSALLA